MPMPTEEEVQRMHRYFAIECNNNAWELAERGERTKEQEQEMISLSEVAAWHWSKVGTPINAARADMLRGWVCCVVGWGTDARVYTDRVHNKLADQPEGINNWDTAFAALLEAYTRLVQGDQAAFETAMSELDTPRQSLDEDDKKVFDSFRTRIRP